MAYASYQRLRGSIVSIVSYKRKILYLPEQYQVCLTALDEILIRLNLT
jgi:hypothetical protein